MTEVTVVNIALAGAYVRDPLEGSFNCSCKGPGRDLRCSSSVYVFCVLLYGGNAKVALFPAFKFR